jgi:tetratricopeptide (TPR) repeat protein
VIFTSLLLLDIALLHNLFNRLFLFQQTLFISVSFKGFGSREQFLTGSDFKTSYGVRHMSDNYMAIKMFDEGIAAYLRGDFKASIKIFTQALNHDSKFALAYSSRGAAHLKSGKQFRTLTVPYG